MRKRFLSFLQYAIFLGGGIFLVWWQLRSMTPDEKTDFYAALRGSNLWPILPVVIMIILSHLSRAMRWKLLMDPLGYKPKLTNVFSALMVGYLANAAIPRLGEVLKCTLLGRYEKLKFDKLFGTILVERAFDFICYLIFIGITVVIQLDVVGDYVQSKLKKIGTSDGVPFWVKLVIFFSAVATCILIARYIFIRYSGNKVIDRIRNFVSGIIAGFKTIKELKYRKLFIAHTLFIWIMYLLQIYVGFSAMDSTAHLGIAPAFSVLSLATLAMIATPGGIGSFPIFVTETLLIYNISYPAGNAFGWLLWGVSTCIVIILGVLALVVFPYINKTKNEISTADTI